MSKSCGAPPCELARLNRGAAAKKAKRFRARLLGVTSGQARALKRDARQLEEALARRTERAAVCKRSKEEIIFRPSYRDPDTGRYVACKGIARATAANPRGGATRGAVVYPQVETIFARKRDGQLYRHDFDSDAPLIGQADGSLKIPGSPRKWAVVDGERWMVNPPKQGRPRRNPQLAIYAAAGAANPPGEGGATMARRRNRKGQFTKGGGGGKRRRRRTYRASVAHRRSRRKGYRRSHRRRGYRRNPPVMSGIKGMIPSMRTLGEGVLGATATRFITRQAERFLPAQLTGNTIGRVAIGAASAIAGGFLGSMVLGRQSGQNMAAGGLIVMADELTRAYVLPAVGLSAYVDDGGISAFVGDGEGVAGWVDADDIDALPGGEGGELEQWMDDDDGIGEAYLPSRLDTNSRL